MRTSLGDLLGGEFRLAQDVLEVLVERVDRVSVGGMEGQGDHRLDCGEVDLDERIVVGDACGLELAVVVSTLVQACLLYTSRCV